MISGDRVLFRHVLGGDAHVVLVVDVPQAVDDHGVDHPGIAHAEAVARAIQHVRRQAHRFLAAGDDEIGVAAGDRLRAQHGGLEARAAHLVDGHRGHHVGQPGLDRRLARRVLAHAGGQHLTEDHVGDLLGLHAAPLQQFTDDDGAQVRGRRSRQASAEFSDCGARGTDDDDFFHAVLLAGSRGGAPHEPTD
jgi:hypothetical protein